MNAASTGPLGRVLSVSGSQAQVRLAVADSDVRATVGKFLGIRAGEALVVGVITKIALDPNGEFATGALDMVGWPEDDAYFIENIGVDPQYQGHGLGRRLIEHAVAEARRHGIFALSLYTNEAMTENLAMYAHFGFVETHRVREEGFRRVYMEKLPADERETPSLALDELSDRLESIDAAEPLQRQ